MFKQVADRIYAYDMGLHEPAKLDPQKADSGPSPVRWAGRADEVKAVASILNLSNLPDEEESTGDETADDSIWLQGSTSGQGRTKWSTQAVSKADIPDLRGMSLRDALYLMENKGYRVGFKGSGKVVTQSLAPGDNASGAKRILLELR